ncbi:hypothetical protein ACFL6H_01715 [Candidatus Latescibacterota bacterium]
MSSISKLMIISLFLMMSFVSNAFAQNITNNNVSLEQLEGEWLNKEYLERLKETKSPCKAVDVIRYTSITISKENDKYKFTQIHNFHEGTGYNITGLKPTSEPLKFQIIYEPIYAPKTPAYVKFNDFSNNSHFTENSPANEIEWIFSKDYGPRKDEEIRISYIRLESDIYKLSNNIALTGEYTDQLGRRFIFKNIDEATGPYGMHYNNNYPSEAIWPDKSFKYLIGIDCVLDMFDHFIYNERDENNKFNFIEYGFSWQNYKLYIYNTHDLEVNTGINVQEKEPLYLLTPQ